ncbi:MAG: hypothetical protein U1C57_00470 [Candidatus Doudnabacteria bacterium]|nr:hypothetical protein [Candidatus Doudnabacteria bacterium]
MLENASDKVAQALPVFWASYAKRFLERVYDSAIDTRLGQKLAALSPAKKHGLEAIMYALTALLEPRLKADSKLAQFVREIAVDAAPEMSKRIFNGVKEEIAVMVSETTDPGEKDLLLIVLSFEPEEIKSLLDWLGQTKLERDKILKQFSLLSKEQAAKIVGLSVEEKEKFFEFFGPAESQFRETCREATQQIKDFRQRFRTERRKL